MISQSRLTSLQHWARNPPPVGIVKLTIFDPRKQSTVSSLTLSSRKLGARHRLPFTECPRTKLAIVNRSRQMPAQSEQIPYYAIYCKKALSLFG